MRPGSRKRRTDPGRRTRVGMSDLTFGIFDHIDRGNTAPQQLFRERLRLVETYERAGFSRYHVAEHHSTPLGLAPSPGIYLAAVAERTTRMRFGPMVYLLPLYHPLRLAEEVTMLDQISGGRLDVGVGTGVSPAELATFGIDKAETPEIFEEVLAVLKLAWTNDRVTHRGKRFVIDDVPVVSHPVQKPHPPLFYGVGHPEAAGPRLAAGFDVITMMSRTSVNGIWTSPEAIAGAAGKSPVLGVARMIVVDKDHDKAWAIARRAYRVWEQSFHWLWKQKGYSPVFGWRPETYDGMAELGVAMAGTPDEIAQQFQENIDETGSNYAVAQLIFGDMSFAESMASTELFATEVMPRLRVAPAAAR
jgi:alkanesulfonate monooxygenase SsuD/methylene tetrahydromethanopterin reductase-like flavin-dependent oxidoreductase (luciferase family)